MKNDMLKFDYPTSKPSIIKVIGVGGGGGNAVTHMFREGINDVTFALCNTDNQALIESPVPEKLQLGITITEGLGAGNIPDKARAAAEESQDDIKDMLTDGTKMVFVTAGMGGGTGTGAAPIVAKIAKEMGILTIGIVTIPFLFEKGKKILQALNGVEEMSKNVDALLVINNEKLREIYTDLTMFNAFKKADDTLLIAAKSIVEIIMIPGIVNLDFADVKTVLKEGGVAIMSSGYGDGEGRVSKAIYNALHSPLLNNNDVFRAKKILLNISSSEEHPIIMEEMDEVNDFMAKFGKDIDVIWGTAIDNDLGENAKITILASGFGLDDIPMMETKEALDDKRFSREERRRQEEEEERIRKEDELIKKYYGEEASRGIGKTTRPKPFIFSLEQLDDNDIIDIVINHPAYNRSPKEINRLISQKENAFLEHLEGTDAEEES